MQQPVSHSGETARVLSWGRQLVQSNRQHDPTAPTAGRLPPEQPRQPQRMPRHPDTAVEATEPHWKRANQIGQATISPSHQKAPPRGGTAAVPRGVTSSPAAEGSAPTSPSSSAAFSATATRESGDDRRGLRQELLNEQKRIDDLQAMMKRNESQFHQRQLELMSVLNSLQRRGRPVPQGAAPVAADKSILLETASPGGTLTAAERKVRQLEEDLWNAEQDLLKIQHDEQLCAAALVRMADCVMFCESASKANDGVIRSCIRELRGAIRPLEELRIVVARIPTLTVVKFGVPAVKPTEHLLPPPQMTPLPTPEELEALGDGPFLSIACSALSATLRSMSDVLRNAHTIADDRIAEISSALEGAQAQLDEQAVTIDEAHRTLSDLQIELDTREELTAEAVYAVKVLEEGMTAGAEERARFREVVERLEKKAASLRFSIDTNEKQIKSRTEDAAAAVATKASALKETEDVRNRTELKDEQAQQLRIENNQIEVVVSRERRNLRSHKQVEEQLEREVRKLKDAIQPITNARQQLELRLIAAQSDVDTAAVEARRQKAGTDLTQAEIREVERETKFTQQQCEEAQSELEALAAEMSSLREESSGLDREFSKCRKSSSEASEELDLANTVLLTHQQRDSAVPRRLEGAAALTLSPEMHDKGTQAMIPNVASPVGPTRALSALGEPEPVNILLVQPTQPPLQAVSLLPGRQRESSRRRQWLTDSASRERDSTDDGGTSVLESFYAAQERGPSNVLLSSGAAPSGKLPVSPDRAPLLVAIEPRHSRRGQTIEPPSYSPAPQRATSSEASSTLSNLQARVRRLVEQRQAEM